MREEEEREKKESKGERRSGTEETESGTQAQLSTLPTGPFEESL